MAARRLEDASDDYVVIVCGGAALPTAAIVQLDPSEPRVVAPQEDGVTDEALVAMVVNLKLRDIRDVRVVHPVEVNVSDERNRDRLVDHLLRVADHPILGEEVSVRGYLFDENSGELHEQHDISIAS